MTPSDSEECKSLLLSWALPTILKPRQEVLDQITKFFGVDIPLNLFVGKLGKVKTQDEHFLFQLTMYLFDAVSLFYANGRNQEWIDALGRPGLTLDNFVNVAMNAMHEVVRESVNRYKLYERLIRS